MKLPHYTGNYTSVMEPIYNSTFEFRSEIKEVSSYFYKIKDDKIYFNINNNKGDVEPLEKIINLINEKRKFWLEFKIYDKEGKVIFILFFNDVQFNKIHNLLNFNWDETDIMKIYVTFSFKNIEYIKNPNNLAEQRKEKILKLIGQKPPSIIIPYDSLF